MRFCAPLILCGLCLCGLSILPRVEADVPALVHLTVVNPQTPVADVLADLARQTGTTILTDDTVVAPVGVADLQAGNVGEMLTKLQALDPGLVWHKVYLPKDATTPTGEMLSQQVRALEAIAAGGLVVASPTETITYAHRHDTAAPPSDMKALYLVTDEAVRAQRRPDQDKPRDTTGAAAPATRAVMGLQGVADAFGQLTPDEQRQALPLMFQQFQRILQSMDPGVRAGLGPLLQSQRDPGNTQGPGGAP